MNTVRWLDSILSVVCFTRFLCAMVVKLVKLVKHAHKWGFSKDIVALNEISIKSDSSSFQKMYPSVHCLNRYCCLPEYYGT